MNYRYCFHFPGLEFIQLPENVGGVFSQGWERGVIIKIANFLENYIGTDEWQFCYVWGKCSYIHRIKQGTKTCALWGISMYNRLYNLINGASHQPWLLWRSSTVLYPKDNKCQNVMNVFSLSNFSIDSQRIYKWKTMLAWLLKQTNIHFINSNISNLIC